MVQKFATIWRACMRPSVFMALIALACLIIEIALVERKYGLFTGGFGQSQVVDTASEYLMLLPGAIAIHGLFFFLVWKVLSRIHRKRPRGLVLRFNCLILGAGVFLGVLIAKFELLSLFSDAISFTFFKSLGGGSVLDAALYGILHGGMMSLALAIVPILYGFGLRYCMKKDPRSTTAYAPPIKWKTSAALLVAAAGTMLVEDHDSMSRYANSRFQAFNTLNTGFEWLADFDGDGYSWFSYCNDDHPFDGSRYPFALDIPNNGIDEDGIAGDFKLGALTPPMAAPKFSGKKPHVVHVIFESARRDLLGKMINGKAVAPNLNALAASGSSRQAFSPLGFTSGSLKAMFSGRIEPPMGTPSLFGDFKNNGYRVSVFSGQAERFGEISATVGIEKNAQNFIDAEHLKNERAYGFASLASLKIDEQVLLREFERALGKPENWQQPNYVYFNFQSGHFPYHHKGMQNRIEPNPIPRGQIGEDQKPWVQNTYWNAMAYADMTLGHVIDDLKRLGVWENTILIVSGDHGEDLFDDGFLGHGHILGARQYSTSMVTNVPGYSGGPIGLVDYRQFIHALVNGAPAPQRSEPILLHIGPLDTPSAVGMVEQDGRMTNFSLDKNSLQLSDGGPFIPLAKLKPEENARFIQLANLWARERWRRHVSDSEIKQPQTASR